METTEQILERQYANFSFHNGKVQYFSISTQHDEANTIDEAIKNIIEADKKYNGRAPIAYCMENFNMDHIELLMKELEKVVDIFNSLGNVNPIFPDELDIVLGKHEIEEDIK